MWAKIDSARRAWDAAFEPRVRGALPPLAALLAFAYALFSPRVFNDGDSWWHLASGRWILTHRQIPHVDVFSFTMAGRPWVAHEWLSEIVMTLAWRAGGWSGLVILFAISFAAVAGVATRRVSRSLGVAGVVLAVGLAFLCMTLSILARPHLIALPIMVVWTCELLAARDARRTPGWWMVPLMAVWANLHGSYVFGFLLAAPFGLEALWEARRAPLGVLVSWGLFGAFCLAAALCTPHGLPGLLFPFQVMGMKTLNAIKEWRPADFSTFTPLEGAVLATLFICLWRGVRVPPLRALLLLFLLYMGLKHARHQIVLAAVAPLILAGPIGRTRLEPLRPATPSRIAWAAFALGALVLAGVRLGEPIVRGDNVVTPDTALAHVPTALRTRPVINTYAFGGYLIFNGVRPYIDGRADMYGDDFFSQFIKIVNGDRAAAETALRTRHIDWTILTPAEGLVRVMDSEPGWTRLYADKYAVVHVRTAALPPALAPQAGRP